MPTIGRLDPYFTNLINDVMFIEQRPLDRMKQQRDSLSVRRASYSDVDTKLSDLQKAIQHLNSANAFYDLTIGRSYSITNLPGDDSVLTASVNTNAVPGEYDISDITLATEHRVGSDQQTYADQALGLSGTILVGGIENRAISASSTGVNVTGFAVEALASGQTELGDSSYYVETRLEEGTWEFRLVDEDGNAMRIQEGSAGEYTTGWQDIAAGGGDYDTGRGLKITFASGSYTTKNKADGADYATYQAEGASITIDSTDSLNDITEKINDATYGENNGVTATVVDRRLVLSAASTGAGSALTTSTIKDTTGTVLATLGFFGDTDADGDGFDNTLQAAADASFKINGVSVSRSKNTNLSDVITGVTLNLAADAEGAGLRATLTVSEDVSPARSAIDDFIAKFNDAIAYIKAKTATTEQFDGSYKRSLLSGETVFSELRYNLIFKFNTDQAVAGLYDNLRDIGLTIGDDLTASVSDSSALDSALADNLGDVALLLDSSMSQLDALLARFTGNSGLLDTSDDLFYDQIRTLDQKITDETVRLEDKQQSLIDQYGRMQAQLMLLQYQQQMWANIYSNTSNLNRFG